MSVEVARRQLVGCNPTAANTTVEQALMFAYARGWISKPEQDFIKVDNDQVVQIGLGWMLTGWHCKIVIVNRHGTPLPSIRCNAFFCLASVAFH
jgi:hypothetical protein